VYGRVCIYVCRGVYMYAVVYMCMAVCICVWPCVYVYAVVFDWYLIRTSFRSGVLCPLERMCVV